MKNSISKLSIAVVLMLTANFLKAQTAMQLSGTDCNGNNHNLFADLDAGKAVILHFFMPSCGSCPPPAQKIQKMANNILAKYPGMITGYALPFNNTTTCSYTSSWVSSNNLSFYAPYDSGAVQVAYYGGFGMPTVVVLGGQDHKVLFSTQSFSTSDTGVMRDKIMALLTGSSGIKDLSTNLSKFNVYPNPATDLISMNLELKEDAHVILEITDITGKQIALIINGTQKTGIITKEFNVSFLPVGCYLVHSEINGEIFTRKINIVR